MFSELPQCATRRPCQLRSTGAPGRAPVQQLQHMRRRRHSACRAKAEADVKAADSEEPPEEGDTIYLGFEKGDFDPREGRKGRIIRDDPTRYPGRTTLTGGWAGGEKGLKEFVAAADASGKAPKDTGAERQAEETGPGIKKVKFQGKEVSARVMGGGSDPIYIGFDKKELERRKAGGPGSFIVDDDRKYPQKESLGPLTGVVGGFTGGELGVKQFVEVGDIKLADKDRRSPQSPLIVAGIVAIAGTLGGLFLYQAEEVGEEAVEAVEASAPQSLVAAAAGLDDNTRLLLEAALGVAAVVGLFVGGRAVTTGLASSVAKGASSAGKLLLFWTVVGLAFKFVIEN